MAKPIPFLWFDDQARQEVVADPDPGRSQRVMKAMLGMPRIDIAALQRAAGGAGPLPSRSLS